MGGLFGVGLLMVRTLHFRSAGVNSNFVVGKQRVDDREYEQFDGQAGNQSMGLFTFLVSAGIEPPGLNTPPMSVGYARVSILRPQQLVSPTRYIYNQCN